MTERKIVQPLDFLALKPDDVRGELMTHKGKHVIRWTNAKTGTPLALSLRDGLFSFNGITTSEYGKSIKPNIDETILAKMKEVEKRVFFPLIWPHRFKLFNKILKSVDDLEEEGPLLVKPGRLKKETSWANPDEPERWNDDMGFINLPTTKSNRGYQLDARKVQLVGRDGTPFAEDDFEKTDIGLCFILGDTKKNKAGSAATYMQLSQLIGECPPKFDARAINMDMTGTLAPVGLPPPLAIGTASTTGMPPTTTASTATPPSDLLQNSEPNRKKQKNG